MAKIIRNKKAYDSGDAETYINGVPYEVNEIEYSREQEHQLNYGLKNEATSWSQGKITPTATMTLMMADAVVLEASAPDGLLSLKPFDINITFVNEYNVIVNDKITVKFAKEGRSVTGDMGLNMQYDLFALDVQLFTNK